MANLIINGHLVPEDINGLHRLNDLQAASPEAGNKSKEPNEWLKLKSTQDLITEIESQTGNSRFGAVARVRGGSSPGTYACRELVIAYAAWLNAAFHVKVLRVFLEADKPTQAVTTAIPTELTQAMTQMAQAITSVAQIANENKQEITDLRNETRSEIAELKKDVRVNRELTKINLERWIGDPETRFANERQHQSFLSILRNMTGGPTYDTTPDGRTIELYTMSAIEQAHEMATERDYRR